MGFISTLAFNGADIPVSVVNDTIVSNCTVVPYQFEPIAMVGGMVSENRLVGWKEYNRNF